MDNKPRFEFNVIELIDWKSYCVIDNQEGKVIFHLLPQNGSEYCKEMGEKIVNLLNSNL